MLSVTKKYHFHVGILMFLLLLLLLFSKNVMMLCYVSQFVVVYILPPSYNTMHSKKKINLKEYSI